MTITIDEHFLLVQKAIKRFFEEENTAIYHELVLDEQAYFANIPVPFWSPDLPPLDDRMRETIGKIQASVVIAQAEWYHFNGENIFNRHDNKN